VSLLLSEQAGGWRDLDGLRHREFGGPNDAPQQTYEALL